MLPPQQNWLQLLQVLPFPKKSVTGNAFCLSLYIECCAVLSHVSRVRLFGTPWTVGCWAPLSMGFSWQQHWSGLPFPFPSPIPPLKRGISLSYKGLCAHARVLSCLSRAQLFATAWTAAHQAPLSLGFSRQEYWSW